MLFRLKSIRSKMIIGFTLVLVLVISLTMYNNIILANNNKTVEDIVNRDFPIVLSDEKIIRSIYDRIGAARGYVLTGDINYKTQYEKAEHLSDESHETIAVRVPMAGFDEVTKKTETWSDQLYENVFGTYDAGDRDAALKNLKVAEEEMQILVEDYEGGAKSRSGQIDALEQELVVGGKKTRTIVTVASIFVALLGIVIAVVTSRLISRPLQTVTTRMKLMADGDFSGLALETNLQDEIGQLTTATNEMSHYMRGLLQDIHGVSQNVTEQSSGMTHASTEIMEGSAQIASTMESLADGAEQQANRAGDLTHQMTLFSSRVGDANANGTAIEKASSEVLGMTNEGASLMGSSTAQMAKVDQIVSEAVRKVEGLDTHAKKISELVSVIQDIAAQTNLLALNAAIEAARAGEHGKGFAVVADEVRKLAEQSSNSVTNITDIVENIQRESFAVSSSLQAGYEEVEQGTAQIKVTGETFERIRLAVSEMVHQVQEVSTNLEAIEADTSNMSQAIQEISAISEESAAGVEETTATTIETNAAIEEVARSAHELENMAEGLDQLVNRFKV